MPSDRYFGFRESAELCEHVITTLFSAPSPAKDMPVGRQGIDTPPHSPKLSASPAPADDVPHLGEFIAYALYRTRLPIAIIHQALLLLHRLKCRYPSARGTATSPHRLFLSSLMLSSKISMDDTYSNKSWQIVGQGLFDLREVNQMERELFAFLGWNVVVREEELNAWVAEVVRPFELARGHASAGTGATERKRRREPSVSTSNSDASSSRAASPETRHRHASDAAAALLAGRHSSSHAHKSERLSRRVHHASHSPRSMSTSPSSQPPSSCSSHLCSPMSGMTTPGTPATPASTGPVTPDQSSLPCLSNQTKESEARKSLSNLSVAAPAVSW